MHSECFASPKICLIAEARAASGTAFPRSWKITTSIPRCPEDETRPSCTTTLRYAQQLGNTFAISTTSHRFTECQAENAVFSVGSPRPRWRTIRRYAIHDDYCARFAEKKQRSVRGQTIIARLVSGNGELCTLQRLVSPPARRNSRDNIGSTLDTRRASGNRKPSITDRPPHYPRRVTPHPVPSPSESIEPPRLRQLRHRISLVRTTTSGSFVAAGERLK